MQGHIGDNNNNILDKQVILGKTKSCLGDNYYHNEDKQGQICEKYLCNWDKHGHIGDIKSLIGDKYSHIGDK